MTDLRSVVRIAKFIQATDAYKFSQDLQTTGHTKMVYKVNSDCDIQTDLTRFVRITKFIQATDAYKFSQDLQTTGAYKMAYMVNGDCDSHPSPLEKDRG